MKITKADANTKIRRAYINAVPGISDAILSDCEQEKGQVIMIEETREKGNFVKCIMAAAACLILVVGGGLGFNAYHVNHAVAATVSLEVNPSIQIQVNEKERVLNVQALNKDGEIVIGDMDFSGSDINVVINALIGSMLRNGYLNELANSILISVDNEDPAKGALLREKLTKEVNKILESDGFFGAVLSQTITERTDLQQLADQYGITLGKAQLIQDILGSVQGYTFEDLVPLTINDLNLLIGKAGTETEKVYATGKASDKAYISEKKALEIALAGAGLNQMDIPYYEMDMGVESGMLVYEVGFKYGGYEYEYHIDAQSGNIVKNRKEFDTDEGIEPESIKVHPSEMADSMEDHYFGSYFGTEQYEEPVHEEPYYSGTHHSDSHHNGTYYNGNTGNAANGQTASAAITLEQAKETALTHAGLSADSVYFEKAEQDYDGGVLVYEIEFKAGSTEYEYKIDAQTGDILDYEWDRH